MYILAFCPKGRQQKNGRQHTTVLDFVCFSLESISDLLSRHRHSSFHVSMTTGGSVCRPIWLCNWQRRLEWSTITQTPLRQRQDRGREAVRECTPSSILKEVLHRRTHCTTLGNRSDRSSTVPPIYLIPILLELSGNISLETSRNPGTFRTLLDYSGSF